MSETRAYVAENNVQRERLRGLVIRLSDDDLSRPLDAGWTIAAVLVQPPSSGRVRAAALRRVTRPRRRSR